jgi:hypothetical protein
MEQRGTTLEPLAGLEDLRGLGAAGGPYLTSYVAFEPATEALEEEVRLRWQARREELTDAGASEAALAVVDDAIAGAHREAEGICVVVPGAGDPLVDLLSWPPPEQVTWGAAPALRPLLALRQRRIPHVVALVDRTGADLRLRRGHREVATTSVEGDDYPIRKVSAGGWSHRRFQQRAEETWQQNMDEVAAELVRLVEANDARIVAVGGDERAVGLLIGRLPETVRDRVHRIGVTRAADGSEARLDEQVDAELDRWTDEQLDRALDLYEEELGQRDRAASGAAGTLAALREARVAVLIVPDGDDDRQAWVGATPDQIATSAGDLTAPGDAVPVPLLDGAVAAALASGADIRVVAPGERPGEMGALLRW